MSTVSSLSQIPSHSLYRGATNFTHVNIIMYDLCMVNTANKMGSEICVSSLNCPDLLPRGSVRATFSLRQCVTYIRSPIVFARISPNICIYIYFCVNPNMFFLWICPQNVNKVYLHLSMKILPKVFVLVK